MSYTPLILRPYVRNALLSTFGNGKCWHFDCWMAIDEADSGAMYVIVQTRRGGRDVLTQLTYKVHWRDDGSAGLHYHDGVPAGVNTFTLQDRALAPFYSRLNELHWDTIYPMAMRRPDAFAYSSIALHYIAAPSLLPIDHSVQNYSAWQ